MEKIRRVKILSIFALCLAVLGMSLGFAAFSMSLNISSSATVTPNSDDFKLRIYGFDSYDKYENFVASANNGIINESFLSDINSIGITDTTAEMSVSTINNSDLSISDIGVTFSEPSTLKANYYYYIKNVGKYTAYFDIEKYNTVNNLSLYSCNVLDIENSSVSDPCQYINLGFYMYSADMVLSEYFIEPGAGIILAVSWKYDGPYFDTPVLVEWNGLSLPFTSKPSDD